MQTLTRLFQHDLKRNGGMEAEAPLIGYRASVDAKAEHELQAYNVGLT